MSKPDPQIETAIERVQAGVIDDYEQVVRAYHQRLSNFLVGSCPPGVAADEIAHRAFIEAFKQIQNYQLGTNFYGWLTVIARNLLLAELKRYQRQQKNELSYLEHTLAQGLAEAVETKSEFNEEKLAALRSCLEQLPHESQSLLRARYDSKTPLKQVSRKIGKSVVAIKFHLFAMRKKLLKCIRGKLVVNKIAGE